MKYIPFKYEIGDRVKMQLNPCDPKCKTYYEVPARITRTLRKPHSDPEKEEYENFYDVAAVEYKIDEKGKFIKDANGKFIPEWQVSWVPENKLIPSEAK